MTFKPEITRLQKRIDILYKELSDKQELLIKLEQAQATLLENEHLLDIRKAEAKLKSR